MILRFTLLGPPRTKKNSPVMVKNRSLLLPSEAYRRWESQKLKDFRVTKRILLNRGADLPIMTPVSISAKFFRETLVGDACGFYQALGDFLQKAGVLSDDKLIEHWDGTRLLKDAARPRIEVEIIVPTPAQRSLELTANVG